MKNKQPSSGGARPGAGRKKSSKFKTVTMRVPAPIADIIDKHAQQHGITRVASFADIWEKNHEPKEEEIITPIELANLRKKIEQLESELAQPNRLTDDEEEVRIANEIMSEPSAPLLITQQNQEEVSGNNRRFIGMSDIPYLLAIKYPDLPEVYKTPTDVWLEKTGRAKLLPNDRDGMINAGEERLWLGKVFEEPIAQEMAARLAVCLIHPQKEYIHPEYSFLRAHIDYEFINSDGEKCLMEVKTVDPRSTHFKEWGKECTDEIPFYVRMQVQGQMALAGVKKAIVVAALGFETIAHYEILADPELQEEVIEIGVTFWKKYVMTDTIPPITGTPQKEFKAYRRNTELKQEVLTFPPEAVQWHLSLENTTETRKYAEKEEKRIKAQILNFMGDATRAVAHNGEFAYERRPHKKHGWQLISTY